MDTINSISGGRTSSFMALNFNVDYNVFACVKIGVDDIFAQKIKPVQYLSKHTDKVWKYFRYQLGDSFFQSAEDDKTLEIIYLLENELEKKTNKIKKNNEWNIQIVSSNQTFDDITKKYLPNIRARICTQNLKVYPLHDWQMDNLQGVTKVNLGFRVDEIERTVNLYFKQTKIISRKTDNSFCLDSFVKKYQIPNYILNWWDRLEVYQRIKNGVLVPKKTPFNIVKGIYSRVPNFPLIENKVSHSEIIKFWKSKPEFNFPEISNCVGCFFHSVKQLQKQFKTNPQKMKWFEIKEDRLNKSFGKKPLRYIKNLALQNEIDFYNSGAISCDSGYCTD